ncbi:hypothetical protein [Phyllobacterium chamaecytisi]|uniref:hypothetical protein n=1 Tax=Phyllobacterium chamaecytisi TaxID=2876082 RepID=UPI001CCC3E7B|nr:hypothetical protein [Phyllobacterium sp. KW56]MBZ9605868.1 hypothetical protein [Phyllobacterium sp. KW56]
MADPILVSHKEHGLMLATWGSTAAQTTKTVGLPTAVATAVAALLNHFSIHNLVVKHRLHARCNTNSAHGACNRPASIIQMALKT